MKIEQEVQPFKLPNFLNAGVVRIEVGSLTDDQARAYWQDMERNWMEHVIQRRRKLEESDDES